MHPSLKDLVIMELPVRWVLHMRAWVWVCGGVGVVGAARGCVGEEVACVLVRVVVMRLPCPTTLLRAPTNPPTLPLLLLLLPSRPFTAAASSGVPEGQRGGVLGLAAKAPLFKVLGVNAGGQCAWLGACGLCA